VGELQSSLISPEKFCFAAGAHLIELYCAFLRDEGLHAALQALVWCVASTKNLHAGGINFSRGRDAQQSPRENHGKKKAMRRRAARCLSEATT